MAAPALMSFALYRFEINIRTSAVLGLIGAGGIGTMLSNYTNYREWDTVGMLLIVVVVITMLIDLVSGGIHAADHGRSASPWRGPDQLTPR